MFIASPELKVYLALGHTDMRKAINGLSVMVEKLELDPLPSRKLRQAVKSHKMILC